MGGVLEKDLNLAMSLKVEAQLKRLAGVDIVMTRGDDTTLSLQGRVDIAESVHADAFVSVHGNSMPSVRRLQAVRKHCIRVQTTKLLPKRCKDMYSKRPVSTAGGENAKSSCHPGDDHAGSPGRNGI